MSSRQTQPAIIAFLSTTVAKKPVRVVQENYLAKAVELRVVIVWS